MSQHDSPDGKTTFDEALGNLTGYHEDAIEERFGAPVMDLEGSKRIRALAFGVHLGNGQSEADAYETAMGARMTQTLEMFDVGRQAEPDAEEQPATGEEPAASSGEQ